MSASKLETPSTNGPCRLHNSAGWQSSIASMSTVGPGRKKRTSTESHEETAETEHWQRIVLFTTITLVAFSAGVGLAVGFLVPAITNGNRVMTIYSAAGLIICVTIGIAAHFLANEETRPRAAATLEEVAIANQQRGHLQIVPFWIANGDEMVAVRYRYRVDGLTAVTTESGFMRMSFDEPSPEHTRTNPERFEKRLAAVVIDPKTTDVGYDVAFPPLTDKQRTAWSDGKLIVFLTGEISYRDQFYPITLKHRKFFGWKWDSGRVGPNGAQFLVNGAVRNDEEDER